MGLGVGGGCGIGLGLGWGAGLGWGSKYINQHFVFEETNRKRLTDDFSRVSVSGAHPLGRLALCLGLMLLALFTSFKVTACLLILNCLVAVSLNTLSPERCLTGLCDEYILLALLMCRDRFTAYSGECRVL